MISFWILKVIKKYKIIFLFVIVSILMFSVPRMINKNVVSAHPGRTASDGCHYCRTNCDSWGEVYGDRHCHGGGGGGGYSGPSDYEQGITAGKNHANTLNRSTIESSAAAEGSNEGKIDGNQGLTTNLKNTDASEHCSQEVRYTTTPTAAYKSAFQSSYTEACIDVYNSAYDVAYSAANRPVKTAFEDNKKKEEIKAKEVKQTKQEKNLKYAGIAVGMFIFGVVVWNLSKEKIKE